MQKNNVFYMKLSEKCMPQNIIGISFFYFKVEFLCLMYIECEPYVLEI